jgi:hypothetical protein
MLDAHQMKLIAQQVDGDISGYKAWILMTTTKNYLR